MPLITNVYIDGFNLYYGCLKGTPYRWLDLAEMSRRLLPRHEIHRVRYFTARVQARPGDLDAPVRQDLYLRALSTLPEVEIHYGHFLTTTTWMRVCDPPPTKIEVVKTEEKGSDVNLATYLLLDAFRQDCDVAVVITNDSDLCEPIRVVQHELGVPVGLVNPHPPARRSQALLRLQPRFFKQIWPRTLVNSQLPDLVSDASGTFRRPASWK